LLRVMEKLPASFGEEGVWFADYGLAWELAGLPPQPNNAGDYLARSDEEREAYQTARRGLVFGPRQLGASLQHAQGWEEMLGFSGFAVSLAVGTGPSDSHPFATAYLQGDLDQEVIEQRLINLGYREEPVNGMSYYAIRGDREQDLRSPTRQLGVLAQINRVFISEGVLAASPDTDPIVDVVGAFTGETPVLAADSAHSRLAVSLGQPLSAVLLPRQVALEPDGRSELSQDTYERPADWGAISHWEALATGYVREDGNSWWGISLFYPDPEAAEVDVEEIIDRMQGYRTAITPLMYPDMSAEGLARAAEHLYPIDEYCASLTPVHTSDESGSVLTVWCEVAEEPALSWWLLLEMRDLGFLLP
jgi:hypothetical protein